MDQEVATSQFVVLADGTIASDFALKNLSKALGEAQIEFLPAVKTEENKWGGYHYTPLMVIVGACRPSLTKHHLTVYQLPGVDLEQKIAVIHTRVVHWDSGEWFQNTLQLPAELALGKDGAPKFNQQTVGGTFTYLQKYAYKTNLGIPDGEELIDSNEDKGNLSSRPNTGKQSKSTPSTQQPPKQMQQAAKEDKPEHPKGPFKLMPDGLLTCMVRDVVEKKTTPKKEGDVAKPYMVVGLNGYLRPEKAENNESAPHVFCYDTALFDALKSGAGKECQLKVDVSGKFAKVVDVLFVDGVEHVDGSPYVPSTEEEAPNA